MTTNQQRAIVAALVLLFVVGFPLVDYLTNYHR